LLLRLFAGYWYFYSSVEWPESVELEEGMQGERSVICLHFLDDSTLIISAKAIGAKWSQSKKAWWVPQTQHFRQILGFDALIPAGKEVLSKIHPVNWPALQQLEDAIQLRGYSPHTLRSYRPEFAQLLYF
jgi:integrase/recombinase XerD